MGKSGVVHSGLCYNNRMPLTRERLLEVLEYNQETGVFVRRISTNNNSKVGDVAGSHDTQGRIQIRIDGKFYSAHRLAWFYVHGEWPPQQIDHINMVRDDNRIANLRLANNAQNKANAALRPDNRSGFKGVTNKDGRYRARIRIEGRLHSLGYFATPEEAHEAYKRAARKAFGEFFRAS